MGSGLAGAASAEVVEGDGTTVGESAGLGDADATGPTWTAGGALAAVSESPARVAVRATHVTTTTHPDTRPTGERSR
jgi:hypothetical protein